MTGDLDFDLFSDLVKDATGCRPGERLAAEFRNASHAGREALWEAYSYMLTEALDREDREGREAVAAFREALAVNMAHGAGDLWTAYVWLCDASGIEPTTDDWADFQHRVPYGTIRKLFDDPTAFGR